MQRSRLYLTNIIRKKVSVWWLDVRIVGYLLCLGATKKLYRGVLGGGGPPLVVRVTKKVGSRKVKWTMVKIFACRYPVPYMGHICVT